MKRNRKRRVQSKSLPSGLVIPVLLIVVVALVYQVLDNMCKGLSEEIRTLETKQEKILFRLRREQNRWAMMTTASEIEMALNRHGLNMQLPHGEQVVHLERPTGEGLYRSRDQFAKKD